ncbi:hypothetical protein Dimus_005472 [Dionaea muscipula]
MFMLWFIGSCKPSSSMCEPTRIVREMKYNVSTRIDTVGLIDQGCIPNAPALALKDLILERMGKSEEALSICLNAKELLHINSY